MINDNKFINNILNSVRQGFLTEINNENNKRINDIVMNILNRDKIDLIKKSDLDFAKKILEISNILYNNTDLNELPLEDGVYDILIEMYKKYNKNFQVGAIPIHFNNTNINEENKPKEEMYPLFVSYDTNKVDKFLFKDEITKDSDIKREDLFKPLFIYEPENLTRKTLNQKHDYPELVGTLDKAKFVLTSQAKALGSENDSNVLIFERDFIGKHIQKGILNPNREFGLILEFKEDGVSVEATIKKDTILSARQRGDANQDLAADVTPVLVNYRFPRAWNFPYEDSFGVKFEAVITYDNLVRYNMEKGSEYKNCRTAISSIFNSLDGYKYTKYITLIPLAFSLTKELGINRQQEIELLNKYYAKEETLKYAVVHGNYIHNLFQVKKFAEECEYIRDYLPYMIDGVVVSYMDKDLIDKLGRENSVNKYSIAIKFNPLKKITTFIGWDFSIGQNGVVTPIAHYKPVEFYGTIHQKTSCSSLQRFNSLQLRIGDKVPVQYTNDVMPYLYPKIDCTENRNNKNPIIPFITHCPYCGNLLKISQSGKSLIDDNINCPERNKKRMASMLDKLNLKDFSEAYLSKISKFNLTDLINTNIKEVEFLGNINSRKFIQRMKDLRNLKAPDYKFVGALGFTDIAEEKWKLILNKYSIEDILNIPLDKLKTCLLNIKGIGPVTVETIINELDIYRRDLNTILSFPNIQITKGAIGSKSIRFTGFRDVKLEKQLQELGYDADGTKGVTKKTNILLIPHEGFTSSKTAKVGENTQIIPVKDFILDMEKYLM